MKELLKDRDGKISSKKVFGAILILIGLLMGIGLFFIGMTEKVMSSNISERMVYLFLTAGGGLLGISVLEHLKPSEKKTEDDPYLGHNQQDQGK